MQANLDDYVSRPGASWAIKYSIKSKIKKDEQLLKDQTALYEQAQADLDKSKEGGEDETLIFDKSYWEALKKEATDTLNGIASSTKRALDAGKEIGIDTDIISAYKKAKSDIALADKELLTYNDKLQDDLDKQKITTQERLDAIVRDSEKIKDAETKANIELAVANLASLDDGYAKEKELQKIKFDEKILAIKKEGEKLLEEQNKITTNQWYVDNPNYIKEKKTPPADATKLSDANQSIIDKKVKAAELEANAATTKLLKDKLLEYGNYATERLEIERKYNADYEALAKERIDAVAKLNKATTPEEKEKIQTTIASIDTASIQVGVEKSKALMAQSFKKLKESPEFAMAFEDLGNVSTETLEKLMAELNKYQQTAAGAMRLSDFKEYASVIENITDQLIERNPFKELKESQDELNIAKSQLSLAKTTEDVAKAQDNVNRAYNKGEKARKEILDDTQELMDKISSIGDAIGGQAGEIISFIGQIGSFAVSTMNAISVVSNTTATAISAVEKASVILGIISTAIQLLKQLNELIPDADDKYDKYSSRISDINKMTAAVDDYQLAVMRAKNEEDSWFGSDSISSLSDAYEEAMKASESYYLRLNQQQAEYKNKSGQGWRTRISPFINLYAALFQPNDAYKKKLVTARENLRIETRSASKGFLGTGIGGHSQKTEDLTSWIKKNLGFDLFDEKGNLNAEAYDVIMSKYSDKLVGETKQTLEDLKKLKEEHDAAMDAFKEYVDSMYAPIADAWVDAIWDWVDTGKDAMDSFKDYASDTFRDIVSDLIRTLVLKNIVGGFSDDIQKAYTEYASGNMTEEALMAKVAELTAQMQGRAVAQTDAIQDVTKTIVDGLKATTGIDVTKDADTDANSTRSAIQSMSQESADILTAQFSAMRINIDKIRVEMGGIGGNINLMNINVKDILLSLQSQASSLQIVFNDVSRIARNTDRLEAIENTLGKIVTNGVKVL